MSTVVGRRSHRKSKSGCMPCKRRKVKCDEAKPICNKCTRHGVTCTYSPTLSDILNSRGRPHPRLESQETSVRLSGASESVEFDADISPEPQSVNKPVMEATSNLPTLTEDNNMKLLELELLHNYCISTCYTLSQNPLLQTVWRVNVPRLGFSNSFVMRSILAVSALHLAYCKPGRKQFYVQIATELHDKALRDANKVLLDINQDNCSSHYLLTALTCIIACAKTPNKNDLFLLEDNGLSDWFTLFRGTLSIVKSFQDALHSGPLSAMFNIGRRRTAGRETLQVPLQQPLVDLRRYISETVTDIDALKAYNFAIDELYKSFSQTQHSSSSGNGVESSEIFIWLSHLSEEYMRLLSIREPEALVVFAFYCVLVKQLEWAWWMQGWSMHLIARIYGSLSHEYRAWIQWPIEQIGWVPVEEAFEDVSRTTIHRGSSQLAPVRTPMSNFTP